MSKARTTPYTQGVFPKLEEMLERVPKFKESVIFQIGEEWAQGFRNLIDAFFSYTFPDLEKTCRRFYGRHGGKLATTLPAREVLEMGDDLVDMARVAVGREMLGQALSRDEFVARLHPAMQ